jgi:hypothetical protein
MSRYGERIQPSGSVNVAGFDSTGAIPINQLTMHRFDTMLGFRGSAERPDVVNESSRDHQDSGKQVVAFEVAALVEKFRVPSKHRAAG